MRAGMPSLDQTPDSSTHHAPTLPHARHHPRARAACAHPHDRSLYRPDVTALANCADCAPRSHQGGLRCPRLRCCAALPEARGRGAHSALLAHPIRDAAELGCEWIACETVEDRPERSNPALRNMWRAASGEGTANPRFVVTSLPIAAVEARALYEDLYGAHGLARAGHGVTACGVLCPGARHLGRPADALLTRSRLTALPCSLPQRTAAGGLRRRAYHRAIGPSGQTQQKPTPHIARRTGFSFDCHGPRAPTPSIASTRPRSHVNRHVVRNPH